MASHSTFDPDSPKSTIIIWYKRFKIRTVPSGMCWIEKAQNNYFVSEYKSTDPDPTWPCWARAGITPLEDIKRNIDTYLLIKEIPKEHGIEVDI